MTRQVSHQVPGTGPADVVLALAVAGELHAPLSAARAAEAVRMPAVARTPQTAAPVPDTARVPEVARVPQLMGLRTTAARPHRRRVPLNRLSTVTV